jgi:uncharacterized protein with WD repeat
MAAPKPQRTPDNDPSIPSVLLSGLEQVRSAMGASGALIAFYHQTRTHLFATAGYVPTRGSTLHLHSEFTRECLQTGRTVICENALTDRRISASAARFLRLRSAIAAPVCWRGAPIGIIQLFSSQPSVFHGTHIATLQEVSELFAPILFSESARLSQILSQTLALPAASPPLSEWAEQRSAFPEEPEVKVVEPIPKPEPASAPLPLAVSVPAPSFVVPVLRKPSPSLPRLLARLRHFLLQNTVGRTVLLGSGTCSLLILFWLLCIRPKATIPADATQVSSVSNAHANFPGARSQSQAPTMPVPARRDAAREKRNPAVSRSTPAMVEFSPQKSSNNTAEEAAAEPVIPSPQGSATSSRLLVPPAASPGAVASAVDRSSSSGPQSLQPLPPPSLPAIESVALPAAPEMDLLPASNPARPLIRSTGSPRPDFVLAHTVKGHSGWVTGIAFTSDGTRLVSGSWDRTVKLWDVRTAAEVSRIGGEAKQVEALACSPDGRWLAAENSADTVTLWDAATGQLSRTFPTDKRISGFGNNWVYSIAFSPDGRFLASGVDDRTIRLWDVKTGEVVRDLTSHHRSIIYIAFSPDGRWLATGDDERTVVIWNVTTGTPVRKLTGHKKLVYAVAFSPDGHYLASASADKTIKLWDVELGTEVHTLTGHNAMVTSLAFTPDGRWLASGSWDRTIRIWDVQAGSEVQVLGGQNHSVYAVAFDSRGRYLAAGNEDGTISFWRWKSP